MGFTVSACRVPEGSLLGAYLRSGGYADCYVLEVSRAVSHAEYVEAFYTTWLFKAERLILTWLISRPSSDREARELALGGRDSFAAWRLEGRREAELLVAAGRTRSWLMASPGQGVTRLYLGTAVIPISSGKHSGRLGAGYETLLGFHKLYSRALLHAAGARLGRSQ